MWYAGAITTVALMATFTFMGVCALARGRDFQRWIAQRLWKSSHPSSLPAPAKLLMGLFYMCALYFPVQFALDGGELLHIESYFDSLPPHLQDSEMWNGRAYGAQLGLVIGLVLAGFFMSHLDRQDLD